MLANSAGVALAFIQSITMLSLLYTLNGIRGGVSAPSDEQTSAQVCD